jgi:hypothetical protein
MTILDLDTGATLQSLIDAAAEDDAPISQTGVARSAEIQAAIDTTNIDELLALQDKLSGIIDTIIANKIDLDHLGLLTPAELYSFGAELVDQKDLKRLIDVRYPMLRAAFYAHIDADHRIKKVKDPTHTPGEVAVPKLGKRFVRQGGKAKKVLDFEKLAKVLGKKRWAQVYKTKTVPAQIIAAHTEEYLDETALAKLVQENPKVLKMIEKCVVTAGYGQVSFHVKDITSD